MMYTSKIMIEWLKAQEVAERDQEKMGIMAELSNELGTGLARKELAKAAVAASRSSKALRQKSRELAMLMRTDAEILRMLSDDEVIQMFGDAISRLSEKCWCAGWMGDAAAALAPMVSRILVSGKREPWGQDWIEVPEAAQIVGMTSRLLSMVNLNDDMSEGAPRYIKYDPPGTRAGHRFANPLLSDTEMTDGFSTHSED